MLWAKLPRDGDGYSNGYRNGDGKRQIPKFKGGFDCLAAETSPSIQMEMFGNGRRQILKVSVYHSYGLRAVGLEVGD